MNVRGNVSDLAPIIVTVYNRLEHFKKSIEALKANSLASQSIIYIVSDAAGKAEDIDTVKKIRAYCKKITGFYDVKYFFRKENLGGHFSSTEAMSEVIAKHGKMIFLEDDIIVSEDFLEYMNNGLNAYKDDKRIFSICGYNISLEVPRAYKKDVYLWSRFNAWGWATWSDRWNDIDWEVKDYDSFIVDKQRVKRFNKVEHATLSILKKDRAGEIIAGDTRICFNMFLKNQYTVYPVKSKTQNIGFDGSGEHCGVDDSFQEQMPAVGNVIFPSDLKPNRAIYKWRARYHLDIKRHIIKPIILKIFPFLRKRYKY